MCELNCGVWGTIQGEGTYMVRGRVVVEMGVSEKQKERCLEVYFDIMEDGMETRTNFYTNCYNYA